MSPSVEPFNETKYKALMDGLEFNETWLSSVGSATDYFRLESEYYTAKTVEYKKSFKGKDVVSAIQYGTSKYCDEDSRDYPVLRLNELNNGFIETPQKYCHIMSEEEFESLRLHKGDVVVIRTNGNPNLVGRSAVILEDTNFAFASYLYRVVPNNKISSEVLVAYLNCKYGRYEVDKNSMKGNQTNFSPAKFKDIVVPDFGEKFQSAICKATKCAYDTWKMADNIYNEAETSLKTKLGFDVIEMNSNSITKKMFSKSFAVSGRLDAEYYQPKYDEYWKQLHGFETTSIPNEYDIFKNSGTDYADGINDVGVIKTKQLGNNGIDTDGVESYFTIQTCIENKSTYLKKNDVVFASMGVGSLGKVSLFSYDGEKQFVTDSTLRIYRAKSSCCVLPEVLCVFLQSPLGQEMIYRYVVGSTGIINIYGDDKAKIPIPVLDMDVQKEIAAKVQKSFALRKQSKQLLEYAKQAVEMSIEQGEDVAMAWLKDKV